MRAHGAPSLDESRAAVGERDDGTPLSATGAVARAAFGDDVVAHYLHNARVELDAFEAAVTDCQRVRGFERL